MSITGSTSKGALALDGSIARISEHLCRAIEAATESDEPFAHIRFADAFPADLYAAMLEAMPAKEDYRRMSGRARSTDGDVRTKLDLLPEWIRRLPLEKRAVWQVVGRALRSSEVRDAFMRKLAPGLERRFGAGYADVGMYPLPLLTRDVPGYQIPIHPDTRWKGITVQFYLPRDRSAEHVGTVFHKRKEDGTYEASYRMPFWPNTGYAFAVGQETYHSVDVVGPEVPTRDSILLTYFVDETLLQLVRNRSKRFGNAVLATARGVLP
jgi:hypothetical protein